MPFHYALDALKECIFGPYGYAYIKSLGILLLFAVVFAFIGLLLHKPAIKLNEIIESSKKEINNNV